MPNFSSLLIGREAPVGTEPNLPGDRYGRLVLQERAENKKLYQKSWNCLCDCGTYTTVWQTTLRSGKGESCGCLKLERIVETKHRHGLCFTVTHNSWLGLKARCDNSSNHRYSDYGGRGITYDPRWKEFLPFLEDMGECPEGKTSIDRIDPNGNYTKSNCRWSTPIEQARNKRNTRRVSYRGANIALSEAASIQGINYFVARQRLVRDGWSIERALGSAEFGEPIELRVA